MSTIINALKKALEADPSNWETRLALAEAFAGDGLQSEAFALLDGAPDPGEDENSRIAAARCYSVAGSAGGREILDPILSENPANARAHLALAFVAHREGDAATAMRHFITATSLEPGLTDAELAAAYGSSIALATGDEGLLVVTEADAVEDSRGGTEDDDAATSAHEAALEPNRETVKAVAETRIKPLVNPRSLPEPPTLSFAEEQARRSSPKRAKLIATGATNVIAAPHLPEVARAETREPDLPAVEHADVAPVIEISAAVAEDGTYLDHGEEELREHQKESAMRRLRMMRRDKLSSLMVTAAVHVAVFLLLGLVVISMPRREPPQIVAVASPSLPIDTLEKKKVLRPTQSANAAPASAMPNIISAFDSSKISVPTLQLPQQNNAVFGTSFTPTLDFAPQGMEGMPTLFGEKIDGKTLGVILDVSGSMSEYLPKVIREIDRNFEKASIIFTNNLIFRQGIESKTEIRPILTDDVKPRNEDGTHTPYWFLWYDLPKKAEQAAVDQLIKIFKERPNCYLAVGGDNRVDKAMDHLRSLGVDSMYIFSDYEDWVDEEAAVEGARKLSKADIKVYVQPAQDRTEFLEVFTRKIAMRTSGKELKSLVKALEKEEEPQPVLADVMDPVPVEVEGVNYGTVRPERYGTEFYDYRGPGNEWKIIEVFEHKLFDLVLYGPSARAAIFLKTDGRYVAHPVGFWYHSRKWFLDERGDWTWRRRKWLRNEEPPKLEGNEITWKMILEDEIKFEVWFRFEKDEASFMATYAAELAPDEKGDQASIGWHIPPLAVQKNDIYYSPDFPQGLNLDRLREASKPNHSVFNLSTKEAERYGPTWNIYGWKRGINIRTHDVLCKNLPNGILDARVQGQSFGPRVITVAARQNDILLNASSYRADIELWEGYGFHLTRPADQTRHRLTKTKAFQLTIE